MCYKPLSKSYEVAVAKKYGRPLENREEGRKGRRRRRGRGGEEEGEEEEGGGGGGGGWMNRRKGRERDEGNLYRKELLVCMPADQVAKHSK